MVPLPRIFHQGTESGWTCEIRPGASRRRIPSRVHAGMARITSNHYPLESQAKPPAACAWPRNLIHDGWSLAQ
jgi:hypothetical protein